MKKLVIALFTIYLMITASFAATITLTTFEGRTCMTVSVGSEVTLRSTGEDRGWYVVRGNINIIDNKFIMPDQDLEIIEVSDNEYMITYELNGGTVSGTNPTIYNMQSNAITLINPTKTGYDFIGWTGSGLKEITKTVTIPKGSAGNRKYEANWEETAYRINYITNNDLPEGYIGLSYIKSSGTQYIDTGCTPDQDTTIYIIAEPESVANAGYGTGFIPYGAGISNEKNAFECYSHNSTLEFNYSNQYDFVGTAKANKVTKIAHNKNNIRYEVDGNVYTKTFEYGNYTVPYTLTLFGLHRESIVLSDSMKLYSCKIYDNNTLVRDFVPCINTANEAGLYDVVNRVFYRNEGSGNFIPSETFVKKYKINSENITLPKLSKPGYTFSGWIGSNGNTPNQNVTIPKGSYGDKTYTAVWQDIDLPIGNVQFPQYTRTGKVSITATAMDNKKVTSVKFPTWSEAKNSAGNTQDDIVWYEVTGNGLTYTKEIDFTKHSPGTDGLYNVHVYAYDGAGNNNYIGGDQIIYDKTPPTIGSHQASQTTDDGSATIRVNLYNVSDNLSGVNKVLWWLYKDGVNLWNSQEGGVSGTTYYKDIKLQGAGTYIIHGIAYDKAGNEYNWSADHGMTIVATASYKVQHYQQNVNDNNYTLVETESFRGTPGVNVSPNVKIYTGFTSPSKKTVAVAADGSTVISYYYTRNSYTVTLNGNGGTVDGSATKNISVKYGGTYSSLIDASRGGCTFVGWFDDSPSMRDASIAYRNRPWIYYADAYGDLYNAFGYNDVSLMNHYNNYGKNEGRRKSQYISSDTVGITSNLTLYAGWYVHNYSISYNLNGGADPGNPTSYNAETASFTLNNPTKNGYNFAGWTGTGLSSASTSVTVPKGSYGNRSYTANWTAGAYSISYNLNGGSASNPGSYTVETASFTLNNPTKNGYNFAGWTGTGLSSASTSVTIGKGSTGNRSYTANWTPVTYSISYNLNGGSASNPGSYTIETASFTLNNPTRGGYNFAGWTGTGLSSASTSVTIGKGNTGNRSYTANWTPVTYSISYNLNGGSATNPGSYTVETASFTLNNPSKTGYIFTGWTGTGLSSASTSVTIGKGSTGNRSYTANWTPITYTIAYNANGGSGTTTSSSHTYDSAKALTANGFSRRGYIFTGWATSSGGAKAYNPGQSVNNLTTTNNATINLYAIWQSAPSITSLSIGSYIRYTANGYSNWRVMYNNSGQLDIVSAGSVGDYTLSGHSGYTECVSKLNTYCNTYYVTGYATSARSIGCISSSLATISIPNTVWKLGEVGGSQDDYWQPDVNQLVNHGLVHSGNQVWLASRKYEYVNQTIFGVTIPITSKGQVRTLTSSGTLDYWTLQSYEVNARFDSKDHTYGVRPVVSLQSGLSVIGGEVRADGTTIYDLGT